MFLKGELKLTTMMFDFYASSLTQDGWIRVPTKHYVMCVCVILVMIRVDIAPSEMRWYHFNIL